MRLTNQLWGLTVAMAAICCLVSPVKAESNEEIDALVREVHRLRAEVARMQDSDQSNWLNERRREEVKSLVQEVLQDADTRASLESHGMHAGHNGKKFFLVSEDGSFSMNIEGQIQVRYIFNSREQDDSDLDLDGVPDFPDIDEYEAGFQIRRVKLGFSGHIGNPKMTYKVVLATSRSSGDVFVEDVVVGYKLADGLKIEAGRQKLPFTREELTSSKRQLAVDRSSVNEFFTLNRSEGVWLKWDVAENVKITAALSDGGNASPSDFHTDRTEAPSITARIDVALAGSLSAAKDFTAWEGDPFALIVGGAIHYEAGEAGDSAAVNDPDQFAWTIDGSLDLYPFNIYAAFIGSHVQDARFFDPLALTTSEEDFDNFGAVVQAGVHVVPNKLEIFGRFEWIEVDALSVGDVDGDGVDDSSDESAILLTFGANYYFNKHNAKLTVDVVWALDPLVLDSADSKGPFGSSSASSGLGLRSDSGDEEDQIAIRAQFQLLF